MSMRTILDELDRVAKYDGPWAPLREEATLLQTRVAEMRERESRLDDVLVVALMGGSGVGKSTLLNALAGDELAITSEFRPCTSVPTVYHPPGTRLEFETETNQVSGSALEQLVIVDTPDSDTIVKSHRETVIKVLAKCDLILVCADPEKYLDEATWSLLRPLRDERAIVCVETKAGPAPSVREHWMGRMKSEGFQVSDYFHINALHTFDRKVAGRPPADDEFDFIKLEQYLYRELTGERISRIKRSNTAGLLSKTIATLEARVVEQAASLDAARDAVEAAELKLAKESFDVVSRRLFSEPHLWTFALSREVGVRAKGVMGTVYRMLEAARTLPARLSSWSLWPVRGGVGLKAAQMITDGDLVNEDLAFASDDLAHRYEGQTGNVSVAMAQSGFQSFEAAGYEPFVSALSDRVGEVLRGPARDRVVASSRILTSWPLAIVMDAPPLAFFAYTAYKIVREYFTPDYLAVGFVAHSLSVLGIVVLVELLAMSASARGLAWAARRAAVRDLKSVLLTHRAGFGGERMAIENARGHVEAVQKIAGEIQEATQID